MRGGDGRSPWIIAVVVLAFEPATSAGKALAGTVATFTGIGDLVGGAFESVGAGVSADGSVVVGRSSSYTSGSTTEAILWTSGCYSVGLGYLPAHARFPVDELVSA